MLKVGKSLKNRVLIRTTNLNGLIGKRIVSQGMLVVMGNKSKVRLKSLAIMSEAQWLL